MGGTGENLIRKLETVHGTTHKDTIHAYFPKTSCVDVIEAVKLFNDRRVCWLGFELLLREHPLDCKREHQNGL